MNPHTLPQSIDARDWAKEFCRTAHCHPSLPHDEGAMIGWFANAIMAGYDEANRMRRIIDEQRQVVEDVERRIAAMEKLRFETAIREMVKPECTCERDPSLVCPEHDKPCGCPQGEYCSH